jgi:hypothetical protein
LFSLLGEGCGDLGTHPCGLFLDLTKHGGALVVLGPVRGALGVEPVRGLLPPLCLPLRTFGFTVEPGEFGRDTPDRAVLDDAANCFGGL